MNLQIVRNHPLIVALLLVGGFAAWISLDWGEAAKPVVPEVAIHQQVGIAIPRDLPEDPTGASVRPRDAMRPGVVTADLIPKLHAGMPRVDVEELIGQPQEGLVHPVANVNGRLTYRATYRANLDPGPISKGHPPARSTIGIEFDASRPGHPLVKVHIPDPMS